MGSFFGNYVILSNSLDAYEKSLRFAISNANNINTLGYKYIKGSFISMYSEIVSVGTETTNPIPSGGGAQLGNVKTDWSTGALTIGGPLDAAITDDVGLFILSEDSGDTDSNSNKVYTRIGSFQVDNNNEFLTDNFGRNVFGFPTDEDGNVTGDSIEAVQTGGNTDLGFIDGGILITNWSAYDEAQTNGTALPEYEALYQLAMTDFPNKQGLVQGSRNAYNTTAAAGDAQTEGTSDDNFYPEIQAQVLEGSNVRPTDISLDVSQINRGLEGVKALIDDLNKIFSSVSSKLGA